MKLPIAKRTSASSGQATTEVLLITVALVLVAGLISWTDGGLLGLWLYAIEQGFKNFATALALPL